MRHADHYDPPREYDLGIEATQVFPVLQGPPRRTRLNHAVIAAGCLTGAIAAYVAFATAGVPARPMPSPFAPVTTQSSSGVRPANCAAPLPGRDLLAVPAGPASRLCRLGRGAAIGPAAAAGPQVVQELAR